MEAKKELARVRHRISKVRGKMSDNNEHRNFAVDTKVDYELAKAEQAGLRAELEELRELEKYLKLKVATEKAKA